MDKSSQPVAQHHDVVILNVYAPQRDEFAKKTAKASLFLKQLTATWRDATTRKSCTLTAYWGDFNDAIGLHTHDSTWLETWTLEHGTTDTIPARTYRNAPSGDPATARWLARATAS